jgi:hypothetical protein
MQILKGLGGCPICLESLSKKRAAKAQRIISASDAEYVPVLPSAGDSIPNISVECLTPQAKAEFVEAITNAPANSRTYQRYIW